MLEDLREVGQRMNRIASGLDAHAGAERERLDEWVRAAVEALREDSGTLLKWEIELGRRRRRRKG